MNNLIGINKSAASLVEYASEGRLDIVKYLVEDKGADVNKKNRKGETPLHGAVWRGRLHIVEYLIYKGADVGVIDRPGRTPLHLAAALGHLDIVEYLIEEGADVNAPDGEGQRPLHKAAYRGRLCIVKYFICDIGVDVNTVGHYGRTALFEASGAFCEALDVVKYLVDRGADVNTADDGGVTPLHRAVIRGYPDTAEYLVEHGANVNAIDKEGRTPLRCVRDCKHLSLPASLKLHRVTRKWTAKVIK